MIFTLTFKTPDAYRELEEELNEDELDEAKDFASKFVKWSEYINVEFDTVAKTATVLKV